MGLEWTCIHGFDLGIGCLTELEQADLSEVEDLGRSFGTTSDECVSGTPSTTTSSTKSPTASTTVGTPASGTSWLGATSIAPIVTALFMMMMLL